METKTVAYIPIGEQVWEEDDATPGTEGHATPGQAYRRLTGETFGPGDALYREHRGDGTYYLMPTGYVVYLSYPGNSAIYRKGVPTSNA